MPSQSPFPIPVSALKPVSCGSVLWRNAGVLRATIIVKITLGLIHERTAWPTAPLDLVLEDRRRDANPNASLVEAADVAPYIPNAGVILFGNACAPQGRPVPALSARLALFRERSLIDKTVHIFGERAANAPQHPRPFERVPLVYERTWGGPGSEDNPVGVPTSAPSLPSICDPTNPTKPVGFAPISRQWPHRKRLLGVADLTRIEAPVADFPTGFDFRWYNPAPQDQQIEYLRGDEWIVLDGMHPTLPRVQSRLPQMRGKACAFFVTTNSVSHSQNVDLVQDLLVIDSERLMASVVFRGSLPLDSLDVLPRLRVFADVELPGNPTRWPEPAEVLRAPAPAPMAASTSPSSAPPQPIFTTQAAREDSALRPALPFQPKPSGVMTIAPFMSAPPARPRVDVDESNDPLMRTVAANVEDSALRPATPFMASTPGPAAPAAPPPHVKPPPPQVPRHAPDKENATRAINLEELQAKRAAVTPFAAGAAGKPAPATSGPIPGSPWASKGSTPPPPPATRPDKRTIAFEIEDPPTEAVTATEFQTLPFTKSASPSRLPPPDTSAPVSEFQTLPFTKSASPSRAAPPDAPAPASTPIAPSARFEPPAMVKPPGLVEPPARIEPPAAVASRDPASLPVAPSLTPQPPPIVPFVRPEGETSSLIAVPVIPPPAPVVAPPAPVAVAPPPVVAAPQEPREPPASAPPAAAPAPPAAAPAPPAAAAAPEETGLRATIIERLRSGVPAPLHGLAVTGADLSGLDMRGANLSGHDLGGVKFCKTNLSGARLGSARLVDAELEGADLSGADLAGADLSRANLTNTRMSGANIDNAQFSSARGDGAVFDGSKGRATLFARGQWTGASFRNIDVLGADFTGATLDGAILERAIIPDIKLNDARGKGASFDGARIDQAHADGSALVTCTFRDVDAKGSVWENATLDGSTFDGARMENAMFVRTSCREAKFVNADLRAANFGRAQGDAADLGGANLDGADFRQARFCDARFEGAKMPNVLASRADFSRSNLGRADLSNGSLRAAQLGGANLSHAVLDGADLRDADLKRSVLVKASRTGTKLSGANTKDAIEHDPNE